MEWTFINQNCLRSSGQYYYYYYSQFPGLSSLFPSSYGCGICISIPIGVVFLCCHHQNSIFRGNLCPGQRLRRHFGSTMQLMMMMGCVAVVAQEGSPAERNAVQRFSRYLLYETLVYVLARSSP